jgi:hypothetical protein
MAQTVIGFFDDASDAQEAVERLQSIGITRDRIDTSRGNTNDSDARVRNERETNREPGRDKQSGIERFFTSLFGSDNEDSKRYAKVGEKCTMVTVHASTSEEAERAADLLDDCGAVDVDERARQYSNTGNERSTTRDTTTRGREDISTGRDAGRNDRDRRETSIPKIEENLNVDKRTEERGRVRVRSRIVEKPVEEHVRLREEHINVERQPVNRKVAGDELENFREKNIELTERSEVPVVNKEAKVVEEVKISKDVQHRDETIKDKVRHTEVDVDRIDQNDRRDNRNDRERRDLRNDEDDISERRD